MQKRPLNAPSFMLSGAADAVKRQLSPGKLEAPRCPRVLMHARQRGVALPHPSVFFLAITGLALKANAGRRRCGPCSRASRARWRSSLSETTYPLRRQNRVDLPALWR